nr:hypothetical protein [Tanacetum cinerariifolium]
MLVESDYESWKIRIERYIHGKPLGNLIWRSIQNGPTPHPQITVTEGQGAAAVQVTRDKTDEEFTKIENNRELADIQATNILSQGLPRHVFNILNQTRTGKEIKDNVELLMKGLGKSLQQKKEELFDEYERFRAITNESIHDYFNNKDIFATTYVELYTYLKSYEPHAMKTLKKQEQSSSIVDPLPYLASTTHHLMPTQPTNPPPSTSSLILPPQPAAQSSNDAMLATMNQIVNLLSGFQKQFPPTNNQLRTSSNSRSHATVHDGQIVTETVQRKAPGNVGNTCTRGTQSYGQEKKRVKDSQYFKDKMLLMEAKEKGAVLDAEAEAFLADVECTAPYDQPLAITTTNIFEVSHEDAYDSDVDEGPHAAAAFMANLSSISGTNGATTSHVNEVHTDDNQIFDNVNHLLVREMHQEEHLDSDVESDIDDNTILYHQYQLDSEVQDVPTEVSSVSPGEKSMITILDDLRNQLDGHLKVNQEQSMVNESLRAELARSEAVQIILIGIDNDIYSTVYACSNACEMWKVIERLKQGELINVQDLETNLYWEFGKFTSQDGESLESYYSRFYKMMNEPIKNQCKVTNHQVNVQFLLQLQPEWQRFVTLVKECQELKTVSNHKLYDILKQHQHEVNEIRAKKIARVANPLTLVAQQQPVYHPQTHPTHYTQNSSTRSQQAATRNRGKATVNTSQPIYDQEPSMVDEDDETSKDQEIDKLMALISLSFKKIYKPTNNNIRTSSNTSRANQDNSPRINRNPGYENQRIGNVTGARENVGSTVVQKSRIQCYSCKEFGHEEAGIQLNAEQPDWRDDTDDDELEDQELEVQYLVWRILETIVDKFMIRFGVNVSLDSGFPLNANNMFNVEPIVGVKPATRASKPMSKSDTQNHSTLPAKREKARRVEDYLRNLNKQNHVDSRLNVKRTGFVLKSNTVCNACNESLVFTNHDNCMVPNLKSVNIKTPTAKHNVKTTKKVWKAKVVTIRSQGKPTGRRFTLYDEYPLTRIVEPIIEHLKLTPCVSSNSKVTMISRFTDYKLSNQKAGSKGIS